MNRDLFKLKKKEFCSYFHNLWTDSKPLVKMFRTDSQGYLYDTGTNKIFSCGDLEFKLLNNLMKFRIDEALDISASYCHPDEYLDVLNRLRSIIEEKKALKTTKKLIQFKKGDLDSLEFAINKDLGMILLEVTERCNLRCAYCIYDSHYKEKRNHGTRNMNLDIAIKAIDHLARSCSNKGKVGIAFYGGEPLLCFQLIKSCVEYSHSVMKNKEIGYSITTNATLMTPRIADYLSKEGFGVRVSIDGPQEIHDEYRKDIIGQGSFHKTIAGLKLLFDAYGDNKKKVGLSMVFAPPFSNDKINRIAKLWDEYKWIPQSTAINFSYSHGFFPPARCDKSQHDWNFSSFDWASKEFIEYFKIEKQPHPIASNVVENEMVHLVQRQVYSGPIQNFSLNGCCIPAGRKQFVAVDGKLILCERIGMAPEIGNVVRGVDLEKIKKIYIEEYSEESLPFCSECWALQLCSMCYLHAYSEGKINVEMKNHYCADFRKLKEKHLILYCNLLEIRNTGLDYLLKWEVS